MFNLTKRNVYARAASVLKVIALTAAFSSGYVMAHNGPSWLAAGLFALSISLCEIGCALHDRLLIVGYRLALPFEAEKPSGDSTA